SAEGALLLLGHPGPEFHVAEWSDDRCGRSVRDLWTSGGLVYFWNPNLNESLAELDALYQYSRAQQLQFIVIALRQVCSLREANALLLERNKTGDYVLPLDLFKWPFPVGLDAAATGGSGSGQT